MVKSVFLIGIVAVVAVIAVFVMLSNKPAITGYAIDPLKEARAGQYCYKALDQWLVNHPLATAEEQMNYVRDCTVQLIE